MGRIREIVSETIWALKESAEDIKSKPFSQAQKGTMGDIVYETEIEPVRRLPKEMEEEMETQFEQEDSYDDDLPSCGVIESRETFAREFEDGLSI